MPAGAFPFEPDQQPAAPKRFYGKQAGHDDPTVAHDENSGLAAFTAEVVFAGVQPGHDEPTVIGSVKRMKGIEFD